MALTRRPIHFNPNARSWTAPTPPDPGLTANFHQNLPHYQPSRLVSLDQLAQEIGVGAVYVKDESSRLGLPSFKILGASWGTFRAVTQWLDLPVDRSIDAVVEALRGKEVTLYATTEGNHGRAVARMGSLLSVGVEIHVPASMPQTTIEFIESEGATVVKSTGSYEDAMATAHERSKSHTGGILVQDTGFDGYEDVPQWIVEGYSTMLWEIDDQLVDKKADLAICPVGVGSLAQSVVSHFKRRGESTVVLTVEPDTAACLWRSLRKGDLVTSETTPTIMAGLECGAVSTIAWPLLRDGVDVSLTVSDFESDLASADLRSLGVDAGPCGASPLAALRRMTAADKERLGLTGDSIVVMLCTEGMRSYKTPLDVSVEDPVSLTQTLVNIDSASPDLGSVPGPGETSIAWYIKAWLEHRDIESHWIEPTVGRPSVVGVVRGSGGGKSLMLNGHIDTVTLLGYDGDPLSGTVSEGRLYGRGAVDMKGGVAAAMIALVNAKELGLRGDVIFTGVADEEAGSIGTEQVLQAGWTADAAIVSEPTDLDIIHAHKGFVWVEVDIHGVAAHGSRPDLGVDAICKAGKFLSELEKYSERLGKTTTDPTLGQGSVHASLIKGGEETSSYPALCTVTLERRTIADETPEAIKNEIQAILDGLGSRDPDFKYDLRVTFHRSAFGTSPDDPFVSLVGRHVGQSLGSEPTLRPERFWTDCALLADAGITSLLWGPKGEGLHAKEEWVDVESVKKVAGALTTIAGEFCR